MKINQIKHKLFIKSYDIIEYNRDIESESIIINDIYQNIEESHKSSNYTKVNFEINKNNIYISIDNHLYPIFKGMDDFTSYDMNQNQSGFFLSFQLNSLSHQHDVILGQLISSKILTFSRIKRWWQAPSFCNDVDDIPVETQLILLRISINDLIDDSRGDSRRVGSEVGRTVGRVDRRDDSREDRRDDRRRDGRGDSRGGSRSDMGYDGRGASRGDSTGDSSHDSRGDIDYDDTVDRRAVSRDVRRGVIEYNDRRHDSRGDAGYDDRRRDRRGDIEYDNTRGHSSHDSKGDTNRQDTREDRLYSHVNDRHSMNDPRYILKSNNIPISKRKGSTTGKYS